MHYAINLDEVDVDGAIREAAHEVSDDTRLGFVKKAGIAGGALMGAGAVAPNGPFDTPFTASTVLASLTASADREPMAASRFRPAPVADRRRSRASPVRCLASSAGTRSGAETA